MTSAVQPIINSLNAVILGKNNQIKLALACLLAKGHLLIEDLPGMGKTTLAEALARTLGLHYQRLQFTSDMPPPILLVYRFLILPNNNLVLEKGPFLPKYYWQTKSIVPVPKHKVPVNTFLRHKPHVSLVR